MDISACLQAEWQRFRNRCNVQREVLTSVVNKTLLSVLLEQQRVLSAIGLPRFTRSTLDKIEQVLVDIQSIANTTAAASTSAKASALTDPQIVQAIEAQRLYTCALLSLKVNTAPVAEELSAGGPGATRHPRSSRGPPGGAYGSARDGGSGGGGGGVGSSADYYSQEAKMMRKAKRRRLSGEPEDTPVRNTPHYDYAQTQGRPGTYAQGRGPGGYGAAGRGQSQYDRHDFPAGRGRFGDAQPRHIPY
jgi:hypothetical protein